MNDTDELTSFTAVPDENVTHWLEANLDLLNGQARMLVDDYWRRVTKERKKYPASERGRIGVRIRRREQSYSFTIEWFLIASVYVNGKYKTVAQHLKKGKSYRYPLQSVLKNEPEWEAQLVEEFESEFADIRKQIELLGKFRDAFHNCRKGMINRLL